MLPENLAFESKKITATSWQNLVWSGARVFIGSNAACPHALVSHFLQHTQGLHDMQLVHILTLGKSEWLQTGYQDRLRVNAFFLDHGSRASMLKGDADYTPCFLSEIPSLFTKGILPIDTALIQVTPPDVHGYCSLGVSVDVVSAAARSAKFVVAQVNRHMPRTLGQSFIHVDDIDAIFECDEELPEILPSASDETTLKIGKYVSLLVENGSTLQMGIGKIPDAVLQNLKAHKDLGIHTEMMSDGVLDLIETGVINNRLKSIHPGKVITSFCMGTKRLYRFVDNNPHIEFHPSEYVNRPTIIAQNKKMVAINSAIQVDLTGQIVADSVGTKFYSGIGGQVDFIRGAAMSEGGVPIIALPSTAQNGKISRIVANLDPGAGVVTSRGDVHYVVTEYGIATLRGRSIRERALELIQIAHPKFREELLSQVRSFFWVPHYQSCEPQAIDVLGSVDVERITLKDDQEYFLRPLRSSDERRLQEFFYSHTDETLYQRYRHVPEAMSRLQAYKLVNVDQSQSLALCIVSRQGPREVIHGVGRFDFQNGIATNTALVVAEDKRGLGMATTLLKTMVAVAKKRNITTIEALVGVDNGITLDLFARNGFKIETTSDPREKRMVLNWGSVPTRKV